mmetsp:Transcript_69967/g.226296  ORF Transcript_69967/g.226296 Transcript_69967/m.226296 type:complete len:246 (+) Transcript_69967:590-1327(+)
MEGVLPKHTQRFLCSGSSKVWLWRSATGTMSGLHWTVPSNWWRPLVNSQDASQARLCRIAGFFAACSAWRARCLHCSWHRRLFVVARDHMQAMRPTLARPPRLSPTRAAQHQPADMSQLGTQRPCAQRRALPRQSARAGPRSQRHRWTPRPWSKAARTRSRPSWPARHAPRSCEAPATAPAWTRAAPAARCQSGPRAPARSPRTPASRTSPRSGPSWPAWMAPGPGREPEGRHRQGPLPAQIPCR